MTQNYPSHVKPVRHQPVTPVSIISRALITTETALGRLHAQRTELLEQIKSLSLKVVEVDIQARQLEAAQKTWKPAPIVSVPLIPEPEPEPEPERLEATTGGRPISGVFSTNNWLRILEGGKENIADVAHFYDRPESGIARVKARADNGELPDSKMKDIFYQHLLDGEDPQYIADQLKRPLSWVRNYQNLFAAYTVRYNKGLPVPDYIKGLLEA